MRTTTLIIGDEDGLRSPSDKRVRRTIYTQAPEYGREMKARRARIGLTQVEFAKIADIHQVTLSRLETGTIALTDEMRSRIEAAFKLLEG